MKTVVADREYTRTEKALRAALQRIVEESQRDTAYSWCDIKLARCNEIALGALAELDRMVDAQHQEAAIGARQWLDSIDRLKK